VAVLKDGSDRIDQNPWNEHDKVTRKRLTEADALALLDNPEPVKPATRKVVLTEWLIECLDGDVITMWRQHKPFVSDKEKLHAIGSREIEVSL
jgi:hypothetical protein